MSFATTFTAAALALALWAPSAQAAPRLQLPGLERSKLLQEDASRSLDRSRPSPVRYALGLEVEAGPAVLDPIAGGEWRRLKDGRWRWTLDIHSPGARTLDFGFSRYRLGYGAELRLIGLNSGHVQGPFDDSHNAISGEFWTPMVADDLVRLELTVPAHGREFTHLMLDTVHQGYRSVFGLDPDAQKSGACNVDVVCPEGNDWRDQIRSVATISFSSAGDRSGNFCSGQFMNSTGAAGDPLFLSANHCRIGSGNAASVVAYFNFQNSTCRVPGSAASGLNGDGPLSTFVSGATLLAQSQPGVDGVVGSDFVLLRFNSAPPTGAGVFYSGWDRSDVAPAGVAGIHHPSGDEKRISIDNDPQTITGYTSDVGGGDTHLRVAAWDVGTTERGSSGSGIWNQNGHLVGVLSGGFAACAGGAADNDEPDWYGRLAHAWDAGNQPNLRLRDWLDPAATAPATLDGFGGSGVSLQVSLSSTAFTSPPEAGDLIDINVAVSGGNGNYSYEWDTDFDGIYERKSSSASLRLSYPRKQSTQVRVRVRDTANGLGTASRALDVRGPQISASANGAPSQVCGNGDSKIDPGERWQLPVQLSNTGNGALGSAVSLFAGAPAAGLELAPNTYGYAGSSKSEFCSYGFVDIASGANAVPALPTSVANGNNFGPNDDARTTDTISLGGTGFAIYGQRQTRAVMSTNGYVSFDALESGGDFSNDCGGVLDEGALGPQLRPLHDDLIVASGGGLRYRYFATCPRTAEVGGAQGCHVFQWNGMMRWDADTGSMAFQAIAYEASGQVVYQYQSTDAAGGAGTTIGLIDKTGADPFVAACDDSLAAASASAICIFDPAAQPSRIAVAQLNQPLSPSSGLAAGASTTLNLPFRIAEAARCGAPVSIDYIASATAATHSFNRSNLLSTAVASSCNVVSNCNDAPLDITAPPKRGLYFNAARPGNGLNGYFYDQGNNRQIFGGLWYTALANRSSAWYLVQGEVGYHGGEVPLVQVTNAAAPSGFNPLSTTVGRAWVAQIDADSLILAWLFNDGRSGAERMDTVDFNAFSRPPQNHTQAWYNTAQSGWGLAIESLRSGTPATDFEFFASYIFDNAGAPRWVVGDKANAASGSVPMNDYSSQCPACVWFSDEQNAPRAAGSITITYSGTNSATLSTDIVLPAPLSGSWTRNQLPIIPIADPVQ